MYPSTLWRQAVQRLEKWTQNERVYQRGEAYYHFNRAHLVDLWWSGKEDTLFIGATGYVHGRGQAYWVTWQWDRGNDHMEGTCTCPYAEQGYVCKHMVALGLEAVGQMIKAWEKLEEGSSYPLPMAKAFNWATWLEYLTRKLRRSRPRSSTRPYTLRLFLTFTPTGVLAPEAIVQNDQGREESFNFALSPAFCTNFPPEVVHAVTIGLWAYRMPEGEKLLPVVWDILPRAANQTEIPIYAENMKVALHVWPSGRPVDIGLGLRRHSQGWRLVLAVHTGERLWMEPDVKVLQYRPVPLLALGKEWLVVVTHPEQAGRVKAWEGMPRLQIPQEDARALEDRLVALLAAGLSVWGEGGEPLTIEDVDVEPEPRLYLREEDGHLVAEVRFGYGPVEVTFDPKAKPVHLVNLGHWRYRRVFRKLDQEKAWRKKAAQARFGLKYGPPPLLRLRTGVHPVDFLLHKVPLLAREGFVVFGAKELTHWRVRTSRPVLRLRVVDSGEDWFDLQAELAFDDQIVPLKPVWSALRRGEQYIKLADGTLGRLPEDLEQQLRELLHLARWTQGDRLRLSRTQVAILEESVRSLNQEASIEMDVDISVEQVKHLWARLRQLETPEALPQTPPPQGLKTALRPYQMEGYRWLHGLYRMGLGGVLADDMGLGKTVQALAFLLSLREQGLAQGPDLVVAPRSLLFNWQREIETFTQDLRSLVYTGPQRPAPKVLQDYDVVLTTYGIVLRDIDQLARVPFHVLVLDEAQAIKNPLTKTARAVRRLQARHRIALTGTPVENTTLELWSIFTAVIPGLLGTLEGFKRVFAVPIERHGDERAATRLRRLVRPFFLRRTKDQVAPELPPQTERVLFVTMPPEQEEMYRAVREAYRTRLLEMLDRDEEDQAWRMVLLEGLLRLRQTALHPVLVDPAYRGPSGKMEALFLLLETLKDEGHKALVYSQFVQMLRLIREEMDRRGWTYTYLDGSTRDRQAQVDRFQNDANVPFFLISLKAGGVGLNLTAADYVVLVDPWWNPAVEQQAADRTHRIGQTRPVFVYRLIAWDTVEEKILRLQERKRYLVARIVTTTDAAWLRHLNREDVEELFG